MVSSHICTGIVWALKIKLVFFSVLLCAHLKQHFKPVEIQPKEKKRKKWQSQIFAICFYDNEFAALKTSRCWKIQH